MAFKFLAFLAVFKLVASVPAPEPIEIDIKQIVNEGGAGYGCDGNKGCNGNKGSNGNNGPGCLLGATTYQNGDLIEYGCNFQLRCVKGDLYPEPKEVPEEGCRTCEFPGYGQIYPYEAHNLTNAPQNPLLNYTITREDDFELSTAEKEEDLFETWGVFEVCHDIDGVERVCMNDIYYEEPEMYFVLTLPQQLFDTSYCYNNASNWDTPECSKAEWVVYGYYATIVNGGPARRFSALTGDILIYTEKCGAHCQNINILGSKGLNIRVMIDPSVYPSYGYYVYASESKLVNKVYGLCDVLTGEPVVQDGFTDYYGDKYTDYDNLDDFIASWD